MYKRQLETILILNSGYLVFHHLLIEIATPVKSWIFLPQHGTGYSVVNADSLETIWRQWRPWRELMEITIEPCADLDETVALYR